MQNINWQPFEGKGGKFHNYKISIMSSKNRSGGFGFLSGFFHQENLEGFSHVLLFYYPQEKLIGFKFTNDEKLPGAFKMTKGTGSASVFPHSFWSAYRIKPEDWASQYTPKSMNDQRYGKIYYIELSEKDSTKQ